MPVQKPQKQKRSGGGIIFGSASFIVICAALVFGMSVFFRVSDIAVTGADRYTEAEIIEASGLEMGDNLIFLNREAIEKKISSKLIYIGEISINRKLPGTVTIAIAESGAAASIETEKGLWLIDKHCRLLEEATVTSADSYPKIKGISALAPTAGTILTVSEEGTAKVTYLKSLLTAMSANDMLDDITAIDVSNIANAQFDYLNRFKVKLGKNETLEYKLGLLLGAIKELDAGESGTFDLSADKTVNFSPN
ncbi:MAG: FtsQ-type POTRA domain-containing protein [Oscillospiraceae bacterium]